MQLQVGLCKGTTIKTKTVTNKQQQQVQIEERYVLVVTESKDEWGQTVDVTQGIRIPKGLVHVEADYNNLRDKPVAVPFFHKAYTSSRGNAGLELWLAGDGKPVNLAALGRSQLQPVQQAS